MIRSLLRRRVALIATLALLVAGPVYAVVMFVPGIVSPVAAPVAPPGNYFLPVTISPGLYGDVILGVETGRDDISPYVAIAVAFYANVPPPQNPIIAGIVPYVGNLPGFPQMAPAPPYPPVPPPIPPGFTMRFTYRPTNDPANPGWMALPAAANQLDSAMQTCMAVAAELRAFAAATAAPPLAVIPQLYLEFDPGGASLEFYKFQIIY
jgi:hypothetical protein